MRGREIKEIASSPIGMYIRNIADIPQKWEDIRSADIMPNWSDICNIADIPMLGDIHFFIFLIIRSFPLRFKNKEAKQNFSFLFLEGKYGVFSATLRKRFIYIEERNIILIN